MTQKFHNTKRLEKTRKSLRRTESKPEVLVWSKLRRKQIGYKFRRQFSIGRYIVDFYCPSTKLIIEIDGSVHSFKKQKDKIREDYLLKEGYSLIRFSTYKVLNNLESVISEIKIAPNEISTSPNPSSPEEGN